MSKRNVCSSFKHTLLIQNAIKSRFLPEFGQHVCLCRTSFAVTTTLALIILLPKSIASPKSIVSRASSAEQASNTLTAQQRTQRQLAESLAAELNHLARNTKLDSSKTPISNQKIPVRKTQTEELPTFVHKIQPWTAVNRELKSRQLQIAKVRRM